MMAPSRCCRRRSRWWFARRPPLLLPRSTMKMGGIIPRSVTATTKTTTMRTFASVASSSAAEEEEEEGVAEARAHRDERRRPSPVTHVHSALGGGGDSRRRLVPYELGHACQHAFLDLRLEHRRRCKLRREKKNGNDDCDHADHADGAGGGVDRLLLFEHDHVYTLGRGADESHLTFLSGGGGEDADSSVEEEGAARMEDMRMRLSRTARGPDSARLTSRSHRISHSDLLGGILDLGKTRRDDDDDGDEDDTESANNGPGTAARRDRRPPRSERRRPPPPPPPPPPPVRAPNGAPVYRIERGGEVTYHGPGQLVAYPMLDLTREPYRRDLHWYLRTVEDVVIRTLGVYGIEGTRDAEHTGVWVGDRKIAAVGVSSSRWITTHGFAINVSPDLSYFDRSVIIPCGIGADGGGDGGGGGGGGGDRRGRRRGVTSIAEEVGVVDVPTVEEVADATVRSFGAVFGVGTVMGGALPH